MGRRGVGVIVTAVATLTIAPCAPASAETIRPGEADGLSLGLLGHSIPAVLKQAKADPYAAPAAPACQTIPREIAALDAVLGPDADAPAERTKMRVRAEKLVFQGIRGMIPHRDVVRFVTGANRKDRALSDAAMAGWARRGFLKGMEINLGCAQPPAAASASSALAAGKAAAAAAVQITPADLTIQAAAPVVAVDLRTLDEAAAR